MIIFRIFMPLIFLLSSSSLFSAEIESYFKKIEGKSDVHKMKNIDFIYMVNLDQRPEKFRDSIMQLSFFGIIPYRFSAVNGWELSYETIKDVGVRCEPWMEKGHFVTYYEEAENDLVVKHEEFGVLGKRYFSHCLSRGCVGIVLSHLSILQDAYDSGYETIWVMEDDIQVIRDPRMLSDLIEELDSLVGKGGWDVLFTDEDTKNNDGRYVPCTAYAWRPDFTPQRPEKFAERYDINEHFRKLGARYGAYSMIVRRSGMKKILDFLKEHRIFFPFDLEFTLPNDIQMFNVRGDIVSTRIGAPSDNGGPRYKTDK